jgi:hypothetical protein
LPNSTDGQSGRDLADLLMIAFVGGEPNGIVTGRR